MQNREGSHEGDYRLSLETNDKGGSVQTLRASVDSMEQSSTSFSIRSHIFRIVPGIFL